MMEVMAQVMRAVRAGGAPVLRGWLHLAALVAAVPCGALLVLRSRSLVSLVSVSVYAAALVGLYGVSSGYHLLRLSAAARDRMRRLDHAMIYAFIGACYTPVCLLVIRGRLGITLLVLGWVAALAGAITSMTRFGFGRVATAGYLVVGWLVVLGIPRLLTRLDRSELLLLALGGLAYTLGFIVLTTRFPNPSPRMFGYHEVWHTMVVAGSACHYVLFWQLAR